MRVALPTPVVGKLGEEFDRVFDRLLAPRLFTEPLLPPFPYEATGAQWIPVMDVIETPAEYVVRLELFLRDGARLDLQSTEPIVVS